MRTVTLASQIEKVLLIALRDESSLIGNGSIRSGIQGRKHGSN